MFFNKTFEEPIKKVKIKDVIYQLNDEEKTAFIINCDNSTSSNIFIPRSINYESQEYTIVRISKKSFCDTAYINSLKFADDSAVQVIEKEAFYNSQINSITLPSSLVDLEEGWCSSAHQLKKIDIMPNNSRYSVYNNDIIIGKSNIENDEFDVLVFASRDIKVAKIPSFIKIIGSYSFNRCENLERIEIPKNSELRIIEKYAFLSSSIERIEIPQKVKIICEGAFSFCYQLYKIEIPMNSELEIIENKAFHKSLIDKILIPSNVIELKDGWCSETEKLTMINVNPDNKRYKSIKNVYIFGKSNIENDEFDVLVFATRNIKKVIIPEYIKIIGSFSFHKCISIESVTIEMNSKLRSIENGAFSESSLKSISIPPHVVKIGESAFALCKNLKNIEIMENSELQTIENEAFEYSLIENIKIPAKVTKIGDEVFYSCEYLKQIEIPKDSELKTIGEKAFKNSIIESISIPSNLVELKDEWCCGTPELNEIIVAENNKRYKTYENKFLIGKSNIENDEYDVLLFAVRNIQNATIPSFIKIIGSYSFNQCNELQRIEIPNNSQLHTIDSYAFEDSSIESISVPPYLKKICECAFINCRKMRRIEIPENSELQIIEKEAFKNSIIESISIPSNLVELKDGWCCGLSKLKEINVSENNKRYKTYENKFLIGKSNIENDEYDVLVFAFRNIQNAAIPSFIKIIGSYSFNQCDELQRIEIPNNSQLHTIDSYAFKNSSLNTISISPHITTICKGAFSHCKQLRKVKIPTNSNLEIIERESFSYSIIESIYISSRITTISRSAFISCHNLQIIEISENSNLSYYDIKNIVKKTKTKLMIPVKLNHQFQYYL